MPENVVDGGEDDDDDIVPLSQVFSVREQRSKSSVQQTPRVWEGMEDTSVSDRPEQGGKGSCVARRFNTGDIVWAKISSRTWWPGWIYGSRGSKSLVSFFGRKRARLVEEFEICGFEENYLQMSEMDGGGLSSSIRCALGEMSGRTAEGLSCGCRSMPKPGLSVSQVEEVRKMFKPVETLGFVLAMAVSVWIDDSLAVSAVRATAQVIAYRRYVSVGQIDESSEEFQPEYLLSFLRDMAVCPWIRGKGSAARARATATAHINAFRRFVMVCPECVYLDILGADAVGDNFEGNLLGMSSDLLLHGEPEDYFSEEEQGKDYEVFQGKNLGDQICCVMNNADVGIPSSDDECEIKENYKIQPSAAYGASAESDTGINDKSMFCVGDFKCTASIKTESHHGFELRSELVGSQIKRAPCITDNPASTYQDNTVDIKSDLMTAAKISSNFEANVATLNCPGSDSSKMCCLLSKQDNVPTGENNFLVRLKTQTNSHLAVDFSLKHQTRKMDGTHHPDANAPQVLHELLWHLHCLALDPFYLRFWKLRSVCKKILNFRTSIFENIPDHYSGIYMSEDDNETNGWEVFGQDLLDMNNGASEDNLDFKASNTCESRSDARLSSPLYHDDVEIHASDKINGDVLSMRHITTTSVEICPNAKVDFNANITHIDMNESSGRTDVKFVAPMTSSGDEACEGVLKKRRFGLAIASGKYMESNKMQSFLSDAKPYERPLKIETGDKTDNISDESTQLIEEMFWHTKCLALDPFYLGLKKLKAVSKLLLTYRSLSLHKTPDVFPKIFATECDEKQETLKVFGNDCLMSAECTDEKDGDTCESRCRTQLSFPCLGDVVEIHASNKVSGEVPCEPNGRDRCMFQASPVVNLAASTFADNNCTAVDSFLAECGSPFFSMDSASEDVQPKEGLAQVMILDNAGILGTVQPIPYAPPMVFDKSNSSRGKADKSSNATNMESLPQLLQQLHSLALDPSAPRSWKLNHVIEKFMLYRTLVFQSIPNIFPEIQTHDIGMKVGAQTFQPNVEDNLIGKTAIDKCVSMDGSRLVKMIPPLASSAVNSFEKFDQHIVSKMDGDNINAVKVNCSPNSLVSRSRDGPCWRNPEQRVCSNVPKLNKYQQFPVTSIYRPNDSCCKKRELEQPVSCNASKLSRLYASPLVKEGSDPISKANEHCNRKAHANISHSLQRNKPKDYCMRKAHGSVSHSLHMKFPSGFNLPSIEELERKLGVFGPLDRSRTRVFFYTGAAQVVFLHSVNAEAAYCHARKQVFGNANVLFWLDDYEKFRRGHGNQVLSSSKEEKLTGNLKSNLRRPDILRERDPKKLHGVKFSFENQPSSLPSIATTGRENKASVSTVSPCNGTRKVGMDISVQLFQLLVKCDDLVCEIKSSLGLQSYYSIFTHSYCCIPVMEEMS